MAADSAPTLARAPFSFTGTIDPTRLSWAYRAGLLVVALAMLLLPLVYLGVITFAGAGVWWHLTRHAWWVKNGGSGMQWRLIGYLAPAFAGTAVTFFMIKPVFARRPRRRDPLVLRAGDHPRLFGLIEQICHHVRAPIPKRVQVDCQVNASASFAPRWQSVIRRDLVLTIGLPLVHALSVRELGGVLAHEFGHFAQGSGLRLTMVVRGINLWFARVVHERDSWDARLDEWTRNSDSRLAILILPSRAGVWLSRQVLKGLMLGGHAISCFLTRQMEYDADSYEVKIAGSEAFASTMGRLRALNLAALHSSGYVQSEFSARRLPADLPLFLVTWQRSRPAEPSELPEALPVKRTSGIFDTHPCEDDRLAAAARAGDKGILVGGDESAAHLFADFDRLSRAATRHHYEDRGVLGDVSLVDAVDAVHASVGREERQQALTAIFDFGLARFRPLRMPEPASPDAPAPDIQTWRFPDALERFDDRVKQRALAFAAQEVFHSGAAGLDPARFGLSAWTLEAAVAAEREALEKIAVLAQIIQPYEQKRLQRVARGLERLGRGGDARYSASNLHALVQALGTVAAALEVGFDLGRIRSAQGLLEQLMETSPKPETTRSRRDRLTPLIDDAVARVRQILAGVPCPALLDTHAATLDEVCGLGGTLDRPGQALIGVETLHTRLVLELCWLALRGEATV